MRLSGMTNKQKANKLFWVAKSLKVPTIENRLLNESVGRVLVVSNIPRGEVLVAPLLYR